MSSVLDVFFAFLRLGLTSFGGPIAHLGYFHDEFVKKRKWFDEHSYADLVALCQFLPGPASSQVGIAIGLSRAGVLGAVAPWIGFTLPSALSLVAFALGLSTFKDSISGGWFHGLKIVAVAIVAQAIWGMALKLCPDKKRASIAVSAAVAALLIPAAVWQIAIILAGALIGLFTLRIVTDLPHTPMKTNLTLRGAVLSLILLAALLIILPIVAATSDLQSLKLFDSFFRAGSLAFGGGHVVLPLLKAEVVTPGLVSSDTFMAGYGAAQAIPGPLFTFCAYLGAVSKIAERNNWRRDLSCRSVFTVVFLGIRGTSVLGARAKISANALRDVRHQCVCCGPFACSVLQPSVDKCDSLSKRFRARSSLRLTSCLLEVAILGRGDI